MGILINIFEGIGDITGTEETAMLDTEGPAHDQRIAGGLLNDGFSTLLSALSGAMPTSNYGRVCKPSTPWKLFGVLHVCGCPTVYSHICVGLQSTTEQWCHRRYPVRITIRGVCSRLSIAPGWHRWQVCWLDPYHPAMRAGWLCGLSLCHACCRGLQGAREVPSLLTTTNSCTLPNTAHSHSCWPWTPGHADLALYRCQHAHVWPWYVGYAAGIQHAAGIFVSVYHHVQTNCTTYYIGVTVVPAWATPNLWPSLPADASFIGSLQDTVIIILTTGFALGAIVGILLHALMPQESSVAYIQADIAHLQRQLEAAQGAGAPTEQGHRDQARVYIEESNTSATCRSGDKSVQMASIVGSSSMGSVVGGAMTAAAGTAAAPASDGHQLVEVNLMGEQQP